MTKYVQTYSHLEIGEMGEMDEIVEMVKIGRHFAHFARATNLQKTCSSDYPVQSKAAVLTTGTELGKNSGAKKGSFLTISGKELLEVLFPEILAFQRINHLNNNISQNGIEINLYGSH